MAVRPDAARPVDTLPLDDREAIKHVQDEHARMRAEKKGQAYGQTPGHYYAEAMNYLYARWNALMGSRWENVDQIKEAFKAEGDDPNSALEGFASSLR